MPAGTARPAAHPPLVERKQRQARERIVRAAEELFQEHGFDAASVSDIAERAEAPVHRSRPDHGQQHYWGLLLGSVPERRPEAGPTIGLEQHPHDREGFARRQA